MVWEPQGLRALLTEEQKTDEMAVEPSIYPQVQAAEKLEQEIQEALAICGGDPMKALRITLIANAFRTCRQSWEFAG